MPKTFTKIVDPSTEKVTVTVIVPDPVPTLNGNVIGFTQGDPVISQDPPSGQEQKFTFDQLTTEVNSGGRGIIDFYGNKAFPYTGTDNYYRFSWAQLQKDVNSYDWSAFDSVMKLTIANGQKLLFRVGAVDNSAIGGTVTISGVKSCYPTFVYTQMQNESVKPWNDGKAWYPNWNSNSFLTAWENFNLELAKHIKEKYPNNVFSIDFGGYGNYLAEWHMDGIPEPSANKATAASMIRMMQAHVLAFPDTWLITNVDMFDTRYATDALAAYAITGKNNKGLFGFRSDHVGWIGPTTNDKKMQNRVVSGVNIATELKNRRLYAPCIAEPMNGTSGLAPAGGKVFDTLIDEVNDYGFSMIENEAGVKTADAQANFLKASKACGYIISLLSGSLKDNVLTLNWQNKGVAPVYENWEVYLLCGTQQIQSVMQLRAFIPGQAQTIDRLPTGTYPLSIIIKDPTGVRKPFALANTGRLTDGSYKIGDVK